MRPIASKVLPRHRRWRQLLASLTFDPSDPTVSITPPSADDFIICGCSRTGTSLVSAQLFRPPDVVTVMEPWDGMREPVATLFADLRDEIAGGLLGRGRLDVEALLRERTVRWSRDGEMPVPVAVNDGYQLGVKWPSFWRYLDYLSETRFVVCIRDPVETIASFKKTGGRLAEGLNYDVAFNRDMNEELTAATDDPAMRRVLLYDHVNAAIIPHLGRANVFVVRYERWFQDAPALLEELGDFLGVAMLESRVDIRPQPQAPPAVLSGREIRMIRDNSATAAELGYEL